MNDMWIHQPVKVIDMIDGGVRMFQYKSSVAEALGVSPSCISAHMKSGKPVRGRFLLEEVTQEHYCIWSAKHEAGIN